MTDSFALAYARLWFAGKSPKAPGTCGSLVAIALAPIIFMPLPIWMRVLFVAFVFWSGVKASDRASQLLGKKDPSEVVVDELFGQWLTILPFASLSIWGYVTAFILFRLFDIIKPRPVSNAEAVPGGLGIMLDDGVAGLYAMSVLGVILAIAG